MKTLKSLLAAIVVFTFVSARANTGEEITLKEVGNRVKHTVIMPESMKQKHGTHKITVRFLVNEEGKVTEVSAETKDKDAKRDLENQFMNLCFKELSPCVRHSIDINFLLL
jgi:hypothetical protein